MRITLRRAGLILIPTLIGLSLFFYVYVIVFGPPRPPRGKGIIVEEYGFICLSNPPSVMLNLVLHNDGGEDAIITAIRVDNKSVPGGPSFANPITVKGGDTITLQYIVAEVARVDGKVVNTYRPFVSKPVHVIEIEYVRGSNVTVITLNATLPPTCRK